MPFDPNTPNPTLSPNPASKPADWMADVEGADLSFDDLFGAPDNSLGSNTQTPAQPTGEVPPVEAAPQAPVTPSPVIKTSTGTVYNSIEDAIKGIEVKDALLEELRKDAIARTGIDPVTKRSVSQPAAQPQADKSYATDFKAYTAELRKAAEAGDDEGYARAQAKFIQDLLAPIAPTIQTVARAQAIDQVVGEGLSDFTAVRNSPAFNAALDKMPILKDAIQRAEGDINAAATLPELYRIAYYTTQGMRVPQIVQQAQAAQPQTPAPAQPTRVPVSGSPLAPPTAVNRSSFSPSTAEGRRELIKQMEQNEEMLNFKF
jgi:hypothetical protein